MTVYFFQHFEQIIALPLASVASDEKYSVSLIRSTWCVKSDLLLSRSILCLDFQKLEHDVSGYGKFICKFIPVGVYWVPWMFRLMIFIKLGRFLAIMSSTNFSAQFFLSLSSWTPLMHTLACFWGPTCLWNCLFIYIFQKVSRQVKWWQFSGNGTLGKFKSIFTHPIARRLLFFTAAIKLQGLRLSGYCGAEELE